MVLRQVRGGQGDLGRIVLLLSMWMLFPSSRAVAQTTTPSLNQADAGVPVPAPPAVAAVQRIAVTSAEFKGYRIKIGDKEVALIPAVIPVPALPVTMRFISQDSLARYVLELRNGSPPVAEAKPPEHCGPLGLKATLTSLGPPGSQLSLTLASFKMGDWGCGESPATGAPTGKTKLRFTATPAGAVLWYPRQNNFLAATTPTTLVVDYYHADKLTLFFKADGYEDCALQVGFDKSAAQGWLVLPSGRRPLVVPAADENSAPVIDCVLKKLP
jgi:hypothetical protein